MPHRIPIVAEPYIVDARPLDEGNGMKIEGSERRLIRGLNARWLLAMSGTPFINKVGDVMGFIELLWPVGELPPVERFAISDTTVVAVFDEDHVDEDHDYT